MTQLLSGSKTVPLPQKDWLISVWKTLLIWLADSIILVGKILWQYPQWIVSLQRERE